MAKAAGRTPRSRSVIHQARARPGLALGRTPKNFHSLRPVSAWNTIVFCHRTRASEGGLTTRRRVNKLPHNG